MLTARASGVLLHPTSLPSPYGIGDLGLEAHRFVEWLSRAGQRYWQVLPLGPTDHGDSPYQSPSAFAGNPLLISPELLFKDGLITAPELMQAKVPGAEQSWRVDFEAAAPRKRAVLEAATRRLQPGHDAWSDFEAFRRNQAWWLDSAAEFLALRDANQNRGWFDWTEKVDAHRRLDAGTRNELQPRIDAIRKQQFLFYRQWQALREFAKIRGVQIIGDVPIYVSQDSADLWANRQLFQLDAQDRPTRVAGVPPDYFSATGQLWNNPLFDWDAMSADGYRWWIARLKAVLQLVDVVRIDHFRGFEAYWAVPAGETTAIHGEWVPGPRDPLFAAIAAGLSGDNSERSASLAELPLIAEDLGLITAEVDALRRRTGLPGMKVLQFMLPADLQDPSDVEAFEPNSVAYTGTHDNDTSLGWYHSEVKQRVEWHDRLRKFVDLDESRFVWSMIELLFRSGSNVAIVPLQDVLNLGGEHRMNTPGTSGSDYNNWRWQYPAGTLTDELERRLAVLTRNTGRSG